MLLTGITAANVSTSKSCSSTAIIGTLESFLTTNFASDGTFTTNIATTTSALVTANAVTLAFPFYYSGIGIVTLNIAFSAGCTSIPVDDIATDFTITGNTQLLIGLVNSVVVNNGGSVVLTNSPTQILTFQPSSIVGQVNVCLSENSAVYGNLFLTAINV